jgi:ATP-dependent DNA helicase RecG
MPLNYPIRSRWPNRLDDDPGDMLNRRIGEFLKELDLTEGRGTGIPKIMGAIRKNRSPEPKFETNRERSFFTVVFPVHPKAQTTQAVLDSTPQVTPQVERLLRVCAKPALRAELQTTLSLSDRKHFRTQYLDPALAAGLIEMTVPDKPNSRLQKYRLTPKGRAMIEKGARPV